MSRVLRPAVWATAGGMPCVVAAATPTGSLFDSSPATGCESTRTDSRREPTGPSSLPLHRSAELDPRDERGVGNTGGVRPAVPVGPSGSEPLEVRCARGNHAANGDGIVAGSVPSTATSIIPLDVDAHLAHLRSQSGASD